MTSFEMCLLPVQYGHMGIPAAERYAECRNFGVGGGGGGAAWEDNVVSHDAYMQAWKLNLKHLDDDSQMF